MCEVEEKSESSFGIRKIVDCKVGIDGKRMYKVKWEATWEPEDQLAGCERLIDQFWSSLNLATKSEHVARMQGKMRQAPVSLVGSPLISDTDSFKLGGKQKNELLALIETTTASPFQTLIMSPSKMLGQAIQSSWMSQDEAANLSGKLEAGDTPTKLTTKSANSAQNFSILETFDNPYVKIVLVCKICNKEQHVKRPADWKKHFFTHASNEEKPHKCEICGKGFARPVQLKNHVQKQHTQDKYIKEEKEPLSWNGGLE